MSYETTIMLAPAPGAPGEFLATVSADEGEDLPFEIIIDNYTRDSWGLANSITIEDSGIKWQVLQIRSVDGRNKLPGFFRYLKDRKKSACGTFVLPDGTSDDDSIKGLFVLPYDQPVLPNKNECCCKYVLNHKLVLKPSKNINLSNTSHVLTSTSGIASTDKSISFTQKTTAQSGPPPPSTTVAATVSSGLTRKKGGLLGSMIGAQRKTAQHLAAVPRSAVKKDEDLGVTCGSTISSQTVISAFREGIHQKLLQFQRDEHTSILRIPVSLAEVVRKLDSSDREGRLAVKMDILKYVVYEAVEEVGENDKWIAYKEPSEFLDEVTIAVYKEGCAPPEVLEEIMKGDIPDELKNQQRALRADQLKALVRKENQLDLRNTQSSLKSSENNENLDLAVLNMQKRDRRSIEEIQRDMANDPKRNRLE